LSNLGFSRSARGTLRPLGRCTAPVPHLGPARTPKLAGRTSGTEHSVPRHYTSLAMCTLRRVVRTPPRPRFHTAGDRPVTFTPAERRRDSPAEWPLPQKVTTRGTSRLTRRGCCSGRLAAGRITAGDADTGTWRGEPDGGGLAHAVGISSDQNGLPGHERGVSQGSVLPRRPPEGSHRPPPGQPLVIGHARS
jgi:hypothetical protein